LLTHGGGLPEQTSRVVGRSREAAAVRDTLARARLVTLTGPGGVGKTRLAVALAGELARAFPDGRFLADLSAARDAPGVARAVTAALGSSAGESGSSGESGPAGRVRGRRLLLILDTADAAVDACAALAHEILRGGGPALLVTSRQPLDLPGEVVFRVPPLAVGDGDDADGADDGGGGGDAVRLLADRAAAAVPGFRLARGTRPAAVRLCRLLDGLPLAIELAAFRLRDVGLDELLAGLPGHLRRLGSPDPAAPRPAAAGRHQSLGASVRWSYDLCSPAERLLWARLSVFAGDFDLAAAEAVCGPLAPGSDGDPGAPEVLGALVGLVDKSVVLRTADAGGAARYRLPAVAREHGAEHAADPAVRAARHRDHDRGQAGPGAATVSGSRAGPGTGEPPGLASPSGSPAAAPRPAPPALLPAPTLPAPTLPGPALPARVPAARRSLDGDGRWDLLTAREREVASLVALGLTNKEIAARLGVSRRTVDAHLEHILSKLGYGSRVAVAALASREQTRQRQDGSAAGPAGGPGGTKLNRFLHWYIPLWAIVRGEHSHSRGCLG
jgi:predicted ATPase/DNA-binding CsgD family transcriptional regulator